MDQWTERGIGFLAGEVSVGLIDRKSEGATFNGEAHTIPQTMKNIGQCICRPAAGCRQHDKLLKPWN